MLEPFINHQFNSTVWRIEIDAISEGLFIELRNAFDKKVYFSALDISTGKLLFDELETEERWFTGIEAAYDNVLLLHDYESETVPTHKGLIAFEGSTGKRLWSNYTYAFNYLSVNGPVLYDTRMLPRKLFLADIKTGRNTRPYEPTIDHELLNQVTFPHHMSPEIVATLNLPVSVHGNDIHYLDHNNLRIVSLHAMVNGALQQQLYIMEGSEIVYSDLLNTDIQKLQPESFLMYKDQMIYLKNKSQLKVLNL